MSTSDSEDWWFVYLYTYTDDGRYLWAALGLVEDRQTWRDWWLRVLDGEIEIPPIYDGWWCSDRPVSVGLPNYDGGDWDE